jgi:hydrogenase maturation protein HypF
MGASATVAADVACRRIEVTGTVQGVGFRPFVQRLATELGLDGWVRNDGGQVTIAARGPKAALRAFADRLADDSPPLARVETVHSVPTQEADLGLGFRVVLSTAGEHGTGPGRRAIPPDTATCGACLRELFDPTDRRYRYPFLNCTDCGPRATLIGALPYDRERTAMAAFPLCPDCAAEYSDPTNRRFHAEPVACPVCGPQLSWDTGRLTGDPALRAAEDAIVAGAIVALKGLGGYQLVCDAADTEAVARLRARKRRPTKPFAVMTADLDAASALVADLTEAQRTLLTHPARPIVLLRAQAGRPLAPGVHPGLGRVGLFLPAAPLHHLLLRDVGRPLVVTSGNLSDEPIAVDPAEARDRLSTVADGFLDHDRPILARYDDSVAHVPRGDRPVLLRRARGYAPAPLPLPGGLSVREPVLAVGAQLKHTFALAMADRVFVGPHTGDLSDAATLAAFEQTLARTERILGAEAPPWVAHDLHPGYLSTAHAHAWPSARRIGVQHHHAHVASVAAEHGVTGPFLGVAYDGLGLGDDATLWGGELLLADLRGYRRLARFARAPLPGGEAAVRHPARMALGYLLGLEPLGSPPLSPGLAPALLDRMGERQTRVLAAMIRGAVNCPQASSAGRLFDAAAALLGLGDSVSYEGEAAIALEHAATPAGEQPPLPWRLVRTTDGLHVYDPAPTLAALLEGAANGTPVDVLASAFHTTLADVTEALVAEAAAETGVRTVCLSGGCFQNRLLLGLVAGRLEARGLRVLWNEAVPPNDGGISYGQAAVAAARLAAATEDPEEG